MLCYEYDGFNSPQTQALVKRPRYLAEALAQDGFDVTVIFGYQEVVDQITRNNAGGSLRLLSVKGTRQKPSAIPLLNKIKTVYELARFGDFSGRWNSRVMATLREKRISFDTVMAFFTPRGPLYTAAQLKKRYHCPLIFDYQDPYWEGLMSAAARTLLKKTFGRIMKQADASFCVNRRWCQEIEQEFGIPVSYLPHVIEASVALPAAAISRMPGSIVFFYSGSLDESYQDPSFFFRCLGKLKQSGLFEEIEFRYAGGDFKVPYFKEMMPEGVKFVHLGWLNREELFRQIGMADILCVFPIDNRQYKTCIPSKFYEYCRFGKPIAIVGDDNGGFADELGADFDTQYVVRSETAFLGKMKALKAEREDHFFVPTEFFMQAYRLQSVYTVVKETILRRFA